MEKPASSGGGPPFPNSRWERSGEPGSAFNGLSRPGRGRGRGGPRGGRGGGRGGNPSKDSNSRPAETHVVPPKTDDSQKPLNGDSKPSGSSSAPTTVPAVEKSATSSPALKSSKPPPRRGSRTVPPPVNTQIQTPEVTTSSPSPHPAKSPNRRRRSQIGRGSAIIPAKINPPAPNDNLLRANKPRLGPVPHTAPIKETPPHFSQKSDMRNDIDAMVERVRAVAMDHRPSTPGSHIDWAGDDDDSLPDLDDWGVTSVNHGSKVDVVSPIIVGTLRSLPDVSPHSVPGSPLKQMENIAPASIEMPPIGQAQSSETNSSSLTQVSTNPLIGNDSERSRPQVPDPLKNANSINNKPLHPSLPAKPVDTSSSAPLKPRPGATPMRNAPYTKSSVHKDFSAGKGLNIAHDNDGSETIADKPTDSVGNHSNTDGELSVPPKPDAINPPASDSLDTPAAVTTEVPLHVSDVPSDNITLVKKPSLEGLAASMHAPKAMADSVSAPADISSYIHPTSDSLHSDSLHADSLHASTSTSTHTRSHTVGRPPSFHRRGHGDNPRFGRSGNSTPRGGRTQEGYHARTHSSPPAGAIAAHLRGPPSTRPVITGDAISKLARTIGKTGGSSSKSQPIGPPVGK